MHAVKWRGACRWKRYSGFTFKLPLRDSEIGSWEAVIPSIDPCKNSLHQNWYNRFLPQGYMRTRWGGEMWRLRGPTQPKPWWQHARRKIWIGDHCQNISNGAGRCKYICLRWGIVAFRLSKCCCCCHYLLLLLLLLLLLMMLLSFIVVVVDVNCWCCRR